jgi:hypothetical protein
VRPEEVHTIVFLHQLRAHLENERRKQEVGEATPRPDLVVELCLAVRRSARHSCRSNWLAVEVDMLREPVGKDVVLLGALLRNQGFERPAEELLITFSARLHDFYK